MQMENLLLLLQIKKLQVIQQQQMVAVFVSREQRITNIMFRSKMF